MSFDSFTKDILKTEPKLALQVILSKNDSKSTFSTSNQNYNKDHNLTLTVDKLMDINISFNCQLYISMSLLPEDRKDLKQKTKPGRCLYF